MDSEDNTYGLLEVLSNGTWTPEVGPTPSQSTQSGIRSVRCFTTTSCDAVGFYGISSTYGLLETLSGNEWTASALGGKGILNSLSCVSPGSCLAVGSTVHGGGYTETLSVERHGLAAPCRARGVATETAWPASRVRRLSRRASLSVGGGIPGRSTTTLGS